MNRLFVDSNVKTVTSGLFGMRRRISGKASPVLKEEVARQARNEGALIRTIDELNLSVHRELQEDRLTSFPGWGEVLDRPEGVDRLIRTNTPEGAEQTLAIAQEVTRLVTESRGYDEQICFDPAAGIVLHGVRYHGIPDVPPPLKMQGKFDKKLLKMLSAGNRAFQGAAILDGANKMSDPEGLEKIGFRGIPRIMTALMIRDDHPNHDYLEHGMAELKDGRGFRFIVGLRDFKDWEGQAVFFVSNERIGEAVTSVGGFVQVLNSHPTGEVIHNALFSGSCAETQQILPDMFRRVGTYWIRMDQVKEMVYDRPDLKELKMIADNPDAWFGRPPEAPLK